jgi:release factor glutamine methyltransferase
VTIAPRLHPDIVEVLSASGVEDAGREATAIIEAASRQSEEGFEAKARRMATQRAAGTPLAYLIGQTSFMGVEVFIAEGALIPRPETELLGRTSLEILDRERASTPPRVIDMCCGSGNLACALAKLRPTIHVWASDLTDGAVAVARRNVEHLDLGSRAVVAQGDLFAPLTGLGLEDTIDMVVCNPPYISTGKLSKERADLLSHEPREAFDGGPYGVSIFQRVIRDAVTFLRPGGHLLFEIGAGQDRQVSLLFNRAGAYEEVVARADTNNTPRVVIGRKK